MYMFYIVKQKNGKQILIGVAGNEHDGSAMVDAMTYRYGDEKLKFQSMGLANLMKEKVEIPLALAWMVESDNKHQQREIESRIGNLCDLNFAPKNNADEPSICESMERAAHRRDGMGNNSD